MSVDRARIAGWLGGIAGAGGAGIAIVVCCATTVAIAGGGLAAVGGILRSPWLITAGLVVAALAIAAIVLRRTGHAGVGEDGYPPTVTHTDLTAGNR
jgi:mercuric ion transport protein